MHRPIQSFRPRPDHGAAAAGRSGRLPRRFRRGLAAAFGALLLGAVLSSATACVGSEPSRERGAGSALWLSPEGLAGLGGEARETLVSAGIRELFVEAATLEGGAGEIRDHLAGIDTGRGPRLPVTLVVDGAWLGGEAAAGGGTAAGEALAGVLQGLGRSAESRGWTVVGYHLDVPWPADDDGLEGAASAVAALRRALAGSAPRPFLSLSAAPADLAREGFADLAAEADFLVPFLYGVRGPGKPGPEVEDAWNLTGVTGAAPTLADLETPYLLGISSTGLLQRLNADGTISDATSRASLAPLAAHPRLEMAFAGLDTALRQRLLFAATGPVSVAGWSLAAGDRVQAVRPAPGHLRAVAEELAEDLGQLHLGQVYHRLPAEGEDLSLGLPALVAAAGGGALTADLDVEVTPVGRGRSRLRIALTNRGPLSTDVAFLATNYLHLRALGGGVISAAEAGDFQRYQLELDGERVRDMRSLGRADGVRLFLPLAEPGARAESGVITVRGAAARGPVLEITGRFALPGGGEVEIPPTPWPAPPDGES